MKQESLLWLRLQQRLLSKKGRKLMSILKNMNREYWIAILVVFVVGFAGCESDDHDGGSEIGITLTKSTVGATDIAQFMDITCDGSWNITIEYPDGTADWCSVPNSSGQGNSRVTLQYTKNTAEEARKAVIRGVSGSASASVTLTQLGTSGGGENPEPELAHWLELPAAVEQPDCRYVTHYVTVNGKSVRNYTLFFDTSERIAYWVAYPHCKMYLGNVGRTNDFQLDPSFSASEQMNSTIKGYDRGHQIPSGDRTATEEMNIQTFYYTNMTPQLAGFNQKIWVDLENKVRIWVNACDTLYVVTGAVLKTVGGNETVKYVEDKSGNPIAVPNYYFKVLMQLRLNGGNPTYKAIAFWFKHQNNDGAVSAADASSVDDIERKTGIDFFANLPEDIQTQVEAQFAPREWGL